MERDKYTLEWVGSSKASYFLPPDATTINGVYLETSFCLNTVCYSLFCLGGGKCLNLLHNL